MSVYEHGVTKEIAKWAIAEELATEEELADGNEYDADTLIDCYNIHHNKKCIVYTKMLKSESGGLMQDQVLGYLNESYETAKAREEREKAESAGIMNDDIMNMKIDV